MELLKLITEALGPGGLGNLIGAIIASIGPGGLTAILILGTFVATRELNKKRSIFSGGRQVVDTPRLHRPRLPAS